MKLLITGSGGFLGNHVLNAFQTENKNCELLTPRSSELNILSFDDLIFYILENKPTTILHMAALCGGIKANKNSPADFIRDNTQMALNIYEAARIYSLDVYSLGSVCAYPVNCPVPFKEDDIWNGQAEKTNFPYGQAKRTLLMLGQTYRQQYGIKGTHLIPTNLFGPHDHFDLENSHVIPALINKFSNAKEKNLPEVYCWGTGEATREFLYAADAAEVIANTVLSNFDHPEPINLGTGTDISIKDLSHLIAELTGYKGKVIFTGEVSDGQPKRKLDVSRARKLLGWEAKTNLIEGLNRTIKWYQENNNDSK